MTLTETLRENVLRLRVGKGMTQEELAGMAGISLTAYRNIEKGTAEPRIGTLTNLASALEVGIADLTRPIPKLQAVRFRALKEMKRRDQVMAETALWLQDYSFIEEILNEKKHDVLLSAQRKIRMSPGNDTMAKAAETVRDALGLGRKEPIYDVCGLLEDNGIKLLAIKLDTDSFFGLSVIGGGWGPAVVVNTHPGIPVERWIFSAVHELGHIVLHQDAFDISLKEESRKEEREADQFASQVLMPVASFDNEWEATGGMPFYDRVLKVKRIFRVSYKTVLRRLSDGGRTSYRELIAVFQNASLARTGKTLRKKDEPSALSPASFYGEASETRRGLEPEPLSDADFKEDRLSRLVRMAIERDLITVAKGAEVLRIQYQEMRERCEHWRRKAK